MFSYFNRYDSMAAIVVKAQQEPEPLWSFIGVTSPSSLKSYADGKFTSNSSSNAFPTIIWSSRQNNKSVLTL